MVTPRGSTGTAERSREQALADAVRAAADAVVATLTTGASDRPREEWVAVVAACQSLVNTTTAAQDVAVAEVARREGCWREDGTVGEDVHAPGAVSLDAADLVAPALGASHGQAERRVLDAVRLAAGREPVESDSREVAQRSGLGGLHAAMVDGLLDGYRAGVVAYELQEAPADVADAVVAALDGHFGEDGPSMRRRVRRLLQRISPDLLRQRALRSRASTGLRRWVSEPGVDTWYGTFPSEDAIPAWAAIDRLALDYVAGGTCSSVEQARGRALTDLVNGNATVDVQVVVTVPADACPTDATTGRAANGCGHDAERAHDDERAHDAGRADTSERAHDAGHADSAERAHPADRGEDLVEAQGARPSEPMFVSRSWLTDHLAVAPAGTSRGRRERAPGPLLAPCNPSTGARIDANEALATSAYRPGPALVALVRARDGRCRFPGCVVAARFCDLDHVRPWPMGPTAARNLICLCRRHHRIKQAPGWLLRLDLDGTATWQDPTGRLRRTAPLDALAALVLRHEPVNEPTAAGDVSLRREPLGQTDERHPREPLPPWSALETHLELRLEHHRPHRRCTSSAELRAAGWRHQPREPVHDPPPF